MSRTLYLLDTNIASYVIRGNSPSVDRHLARVPVTDVCISSVTEAELRYGVARLPNATRLVSLVEDFLMTVTILPWDSLAARQYALLRANLERGGQTMGNMDMMIAAHALAAHATVVTNDGAFQRVDRLKVVDWTKP